MGLSPPWAGGLAALCCVPSPDGCPCAGVPSALASRRAPSPRRELSRTPVSQQEPSSPAVCQLSTGTSEHVQGLYFGHAQGVCTWRAGGQTHHDSPVPSHRGGHTSPGCGPSASAAGVPPAPCTYSTSFPKGGAMPPKRRDAPQHQTRRQSEATRSPPAPLLPCSRESFGPAAAPAPGTSDTGDTSPRAGDTAQQAPALGGPA